MSYKDVKLQQSKFFKYNVQGYFDETDWSYIVIEIDDNNALFGTLDDDLIEQFNNIDMLPLFVKLKSNDSFYAILGYTLNNGNLETITYVSTFRNITDNINAYHSITLNLINKTWSITITRFNTVVANPEEMEPTQRLETIEIDNVVYTIKNYDGSIEDINTEIISLQNQITALDKKISNEIQRATNKEDELNNLIVSNKTEIDNKINFINQTLTDVAHYEKI